MEYGFRLAELFPEDVSIVGSDLVPLGCPALSRIGVQTVTDRIKEILDTMGHASAVAQSLHTVITNGEKLKGTDQKVYMFADLEANVMMGFLKIGNKKLFVFDDAGTQHEMSCPCILDFYVHESQQRRGFGKYLFEMMLHRECVPVEHFAIDRPSDKLLSFLKKHYNLTKIIPQVNNFAVFDGFFKNRKDYEGKKPKWGGLDQNAAPSPPRHVNSRTVLEDSSTYNSTPALHLRNGGHLLPNQVSRRHASSIADIVQPRNAGIYANHSNRS